MRKIQTRQDLLALRKNWPNYPEMQGIYKKLGLVETTTPRQFQNGTTQYTDTTNGVPYTFHDNGYFRRIIVNTWSHHKFDCYQLNPILSTRHFGVTEGGKKYSYVVDVRRDTKSFEYKVAKQMAWAISAIVHYRSKKPATYS